MARELAARGNMISFVGGDYGQPFQSDVDDVRVFRAYRSGHGNRALRHLPDSALLFRAMRAADADIYVQRCVFHLTGRTWLFARMLRRRFVFMSGHEMNAWEPSRLADKGPYYVRTYVRGVRGADMVICQDEAQRSGFEGHYGVRARIAPSLVDTDSFRPPASPGGGPVLWVGRISPTKRPLAFIQLARTMPERDFVMVAAESDPALGARVREQASALGNLDFRGYVPQGTMPSVYRECSLLVSTSQVEGFPNVFLQAMATGLPVVSLLLDPAGVLAASGGGLVCGDRIEVLQAAVAALLEDPVRLGDTGGRGRAYVLANHAVEVVVPIYEEMFASVVAGGSSRSGLTGCA
jgi:glycosyltransferase involved in cell wall biosynthesis